MATLYVLNTYSYIQSLGLGVRFAGKPFNICCECLRSGVLFGVWLAKLLTEYKVVLPDKSKTPHGIWTNPLHRGLGSVCEHQRITVQPNTTTALNGASCLLPVAVTVVGWIGKASCGK